MGSKARGVPERDIDYALSREQPIDDRRSMAPAVQRVAHNTLSQPTRQTEAKRVVPDPVGDGVITTDPWDLITSINAMAVGLTGWDERDAHGRPLDDIFRVSSSVTRTRLPNPLAQAMAAGKRIELTDKTVLKRRDETEIAVTASASPIRDGKGGIMGGVLVFRDVTALTHRAGSLQALEDRDPFTQLPSWALFNDRLEQSLLQKERYGGMLNVLLVELDGFHRIVAGFGPVSGDRMLKEVAYRLKECVRTSDTVSRWDRAAFAILLPVMIDSTTAAEVAERAIAALNKPFLVDDVAEPLTIGASIGISAYPYDGRDAETLLKAADTALFDVKNAGRNDYSFHLSHMNTRVKERQDVDRVLRSALVTNGLALFYQPKVDLRTNGTVGVEALLRFRMNERWEMPGRFIRGAESSGFMINLGRWVLDAASRQSRAWQDAGLAVPISINVSPVEFRQTDFVDILNAALRRHGAMPTMIELELPESLFVDQERPILDRMHAIRAMGVNLCLGDFGVGLSNVSLLRSFPVDRVKIDRWLIEKMGRTSEDEAVVEALVALGLHMSKTIVAEGIETEEQLTRLRELGCHEGQGFFFSRPLPADQLFL